MMHTQNPSKIRYVAKVAGGFTLGGVAGVLGIWFLESWGIPYIVLSFVIGGAIGGASLGRGRRPVIAFAFAYVILGFMGFFLLIGLQGYSSGQWLSLITAWFVVYAIGGGIGSAAGGLGWKAALAGMAAFGTGGAIAGHLTVTFLSGPAILLVVVIPHTVGGAILAIVLGVPTKDPGLCSNCGYNLTANVSGTCPECGTRIGGGQ